MENNLMDILYQNVKKNNHSLVIDDLVIINMNLYSLLNDYCYKLNKNVIPPSAEL